MKKLLLLVPALIIMSCSNDEPNCDCDRVTSTNYYTSSFPGSGTVRYGSFTTVNDCTGEQRSWDATQYGFPQEGDCR